MKQAIILFLSPIEEREFSRPSVGDYGLERWSNDVAYAFAGVAIRVRAASGVGVQFAAGAVKVTGFRHTMQEHMDKRWVFDLCGEAELGLIEARFAPAVALPIWVLPFPIASVVLGHLLGLAVSSRGRHRPFQHGFVNNRGRDRKVCVLVVAVRNIRATILLSHFHIARNANEAWPCGSIACAERRKRSVEGRIRIETERVDVVTEAVVADDAVHAQLEAGKAAVEVGVSIPVTIVTLGLEVESTANARVRDNDVEERHSSGLREVEAEGVIFVLEFDERVIEHIQREVSDLVQISSSDFDTDVAEVVTRFVVCGMLWDIPSGVIEESAVNTIIVNDTKPLVACTADVVGAEEFLMDILGDASVRLFELKDLFSGEKAIEQALNANPVRGHLFAEKLESVALRAGALDDFGFAVAGVRVAVGVNDLAERAARIIETTAKAETFLLGGVIEGPCLLLETGEVGRVGDEFLHIKVVEIFTAFAEKAINLGATIEIELF